MEETTISFDLTPTEQQILHRVRNIKPFERIEVYLDDKHTGELIVVSKQTTREVFQIDITKTTLAHTSGASTEAPLPR